MHRIKLLHITAERAIGLKDQLIAAGLKLDQDFSWSYNQAKYDTDGWTPIEPKSVCFEFQDPALATFYKLKWT